MGECSVFVIQREYYFITALQAKKASGKFTVQVSKGLCMDRGALQGGNKVRHSWLPGKPVVVHREATCKWLKGREELWWGDPCKWADSDCCWQGTLGIVRCASSSGSHLAPVWHVTVTGTAVGLRSCWGRPDVLGEVQASFLWQTPDTKVMLAHLAFAEIYFWPAQGCLLWLECVAKCITKYLGKKVGVHLSTNS